eukprot:COSAG06_NODE_7780_length_2378_cov_4.945590_2_plen_68_part_00
MGFVTSVANPATSSGTARTLLVVVEARGVVAVAEAAGVVMTGEAAATAVVRNGVDGNVGTGESELDY